MSAGDPAVLRVNDIHKTFERGKTRKDVLKGLSFTIESGQVLALLGANGAGKTTLINIVSTLLLPTSGSASVCGHDVVNEPRAVRELISLTGQFAAVDQELTGRENLIFFSRLRGMSKKRSRERSNELLETFRLQDAADQRVGQYSGGMRRRLDIAASLVVEPRLLFLDEPTTGLDPLSRRELWTTVEDLRDRGVTVLLTTQYLDEAERLADNIVLIRDGRTVVQGTAANLREQFGAPICQLSLDSVDDVQRAREHLLPRITGLDARSVTVEGLTVSFTTSRGADDLTDALELLRGHNVTVHSASLNAPSLDDVFMGLAFDSQAPAIDSEEAK
ncbi:MAG: ATP-binding cassette domain-containing protein [Actinomycetaceae bacterium]|nr:ATP-binding cassette domain-containing protein [Actinomycetaceae bacterium]